MNNVIMGGAENDYFKIGGAIDKLVCCQIVADNYTYIGN